MNLRAAFLAPGVLEAFEALSPRFEGVVPWMYLDIKGYVTCGVGLLIDPVEMALALPWVRASDGAPASQVEIREEWQRIKREPNLNRDGAGAARKLCKLRLTPEGVRLATLAALERMLRSLVLDFADWEEWPGDAQLAVLLLVWAVGTDLPRKWPRLTAALRARDWATAAAESHIREEGNPGVAPRNRKIRALFEGLAGVVLPPAPEVIPGAAEAHASAQLLDRQELEGWARDGWRERDDDKGLLILEEPANLGLPHGRRAATVPRAHPQIFRLRAPASASPGALEALVRAGRAAGSDAASQRRAHRRPAQAARGQGRGRPRRPALKIPARWGPWAPAREPAPGRAP